MVIRLNGFNLPGATCSPAPERLQPYETVHVGIGSRGQAVELFRGDASSTTWRFDIRVVEASDGSLDFRGPLVEGRRGDRFIYLNWGTVDAEGTFRLFRRAKVMLDEIDPTLVQATATGAELHAAVNLTDSKGNPTCARLKPPAITWSAHQAAPARARA